MERERTCLRARAAEQPHGHQSSPAVPSKGTNHDFKTFDSERLIIEAEKRAALHN